MATTKVGDRIRITAVGADLDKHGLTVGSEHDVIFVGRVPGIWVQLAGSVLGLMSDRGDRWTVLDGIDPGAAT